MEVAEAATSPTPKPKVIIVSEPEPYQFVLTFNHQAQLTDISKPDNLSIPATIEHLAVAIQFLAKKVGE